MSGIQPILTCWKGLKEARRVMSFIDTLGDRHLGTSTAARSLAVPD